MLRVQDLLHPRRSRSTVPVDRSVSSATACAIAVHHPLVGPAARRLASRPAIDQPPDPRFSYRSRSRCNVLSAPAGHGRPARPPWPAPAGAGCGPPGRTRAGAGFPPRPRRDPGDHLDDVPLPPARLLRGLRRNLVQQPLRRQRRRRPRHHRNAGALSSSASVIRLRPGHVGQPRPLEAGHRGHRVHRAADPDLVTDPQNRRPGHRHQAPPPRTTRDRRSGRADARSAAKIPATAVKQHGSTAIRSPPAARRPARAAERRTPRAAGQVPRAGSADAGNPPASARSPRAPDPAPRPAGTPSPPTRTPPRSPRTPPRPPARSGHRPDIDHHADAVRRRTNKSGACRRTLPPAATAARTAARRTPAPSGRSPAPSCVSRSTHDSNPTCRSCRRRSTGPGNFAAPDTTENPVPAAHPRTWRSSTQKAAPAARPDRVLRLPDSTARTRPHGRHQPSPPAQPLSTARPCSHSRHIPAVRR